MASAICRAGISYDPERNILFLNFEGLRVRTEQDVAAVQEAVESRCKRIGRFVNVVVNYDSFRIDESVYDAYARMIRSWSRPTTSR